MADPLQDVRLADVLTFFAVRRTSSVSRAARELHVTPSQVSKSIARLERHLGVTLLTRVKQRVAISDAGLRVLPVLDEVVLRLRGITRGDVASRTLTMGAPTYLQSFALPLVSAARPELRFRACELAPALVRAHAASALFDVTLGVSARGIPRSYVATEVGTMRKSVLARPALAARLGAPPVPVERLERCTFVGPLYVTNGEVHLADDDCPLPLSERRIGDQVATVGLALDVAASTDQLVFAPVIAARRHLEHGELVEIEVEGWRVVDTLVVGCNTDTVRVTEQRAICKALRDGCARAGG